MAQFLKFTPRTTTITVEPVTKDLSNPVEGKSSTASNVSFQDATAITTVDVPVSDIPIEIKDPYKNYTPRDLLARMFKVLETTVDATWLGNSVEFPNVLLALPAISKITSMFAYMRADVQVAIRITSTMYHQGSLMVSFHPCSTDTTAHIYRDSSQSAIVLQYATPGCLLLVLPYMHPRPFFSLTIPSMYTASIGQLKLTPLTPYRTAGEIGGFTLTVYAQFKNIHTAGPLLVTQSDMPAPTTPVNHTSSSSSARPISLEDMEKSVNCVHHSNNVASLLSPVFDIADSVVGIAQTLTGGLLDKPTSVRAPMPNQPRWTPLAFTKGLDDSSRLSQSPSSKLSTRGMYIDDTSDMTVWKLAQVPMLHHIAVMSSATPSFVFNVHPIDIQSSGEDVDYLRAVSHAHIYWRGSIKYYVHFVANGFLKARVRIFLSFNGTVTLPTDDPGDLFARIVEINGPTITNFSVPYLWNKYWQLTHLSDGPPLLYFELLDDISSQGEDPSIDVVVFRAGGEDTQFSGLHQALFPPPAMTTQSHVRSAFAVPFDSLIEGAKIGVEKGFCTDETSHRVSDLMKRYGIAMSPNLVGTEGLGFLPPTRACPLSSIGELQSSADANGMSMPFYYFTSFFLFWRGDIRVKIRSLTALKQASVATYEGDFNLASGSAYTYGTLNPDLSVELPFQSTLPYHFFYDNVQKVGIGNGDLTLLAIAGGAENTEVLTAAGDNFICGHLMPPPNFLSPPPSLLARTITATNKTGGSTPFLKGG